MMAPRARFELATNRLTADCSTTELPRNTGLAGGAYYPFSGPKPSAKFTRTLNRLYPPNTKKNGQRKMRPGVIPAPRRWVMVGCLQGRPGEDAPGMVNKALTLPKKVPHETKTGPWRYPATLPAGTRPPLAQEWRPRPELNRGSRICSPLRHHSATWPQAKSPKNARQAVGGYNRKRAETTILPWLVCIRTQGSEQMAALSGITMPSYKPHPDFEGCPNV